MSYLSNGTYLQAGKYLIESVLGQGGFGITYEAEQVSLRRKVAIKEFFMKDSCEREGNTSQVTVPTVSNRELVSKFMDKFIREARMIAALDHEHIVKIHDVFEENGTAYYVMEYLGGGSLGDGVKSGKALPEQEAVGYIRQIASALEYLHSQNILHFDVKPSNVLLGKNGSAKLIDFGISKHYDEAGQQTSSTPVGISKGYAPLEQYQQGSDIKSFTPATDIYALGATLYALLSGSNPPEASIVNEDGVPAIGGVSPQVMRAIEKAMEPRRKDRPQSVKEFLDFLEGTAKGDDDEETVVPASEPVQASRHISEPQPNPSPKPVRKPFPKWLIGAVTGIVIAAGAVILWPFGPESSEEAIIPPVSADSTSVAVAEPQPAKTSQLSQASKPSEVAVETISLSKTSLNLEEGETSTLSVKYTPNNTADKTTTWKSSDTKIAKVNASGKVNAVKSGSATIIATCGGKDAYCNVTVKAKEIQPAPVTTGTHNGHEWVDLGLSVKWAACNVGATSPSDYGSYFAWGETSPKSEYNWENLKYCKDRKGDRFSKYNQNKNGTNDSRTSLEMSDDAAMHNWGGNWRTPTINEFLELSNKCSWTWTTMNGKKGYKVTSKSNSNSIFLPTAGWCAGGLLKDCDYGGYYWSSSLYEKNSNCARSLYFNSDEGGTDGSYRCYGQSVRPVCP